MNVASLSSPIALVIPSLWVVAGVFLYCSVLFSILGLWPRKEPLFLAFGALCMTLAGYITSVVVGYSAATIPDMLDVTRARMSFAVLSLPLFYAFVCLYTQSPLKQQWMWPIGLVSLGFFLLNLLSPYTIRYAEITQVMPVRLRWGETLNGAVGQPSAWTHLYLSTWILSFLWAIGHCLVLFRARKSADAMFFGAQLIIQLVATVVDFALSYIQVPNVTVSPYVLTGIVVVMGAHLLGALQSNLNATEESERRLRESEQRLSLTLEATSSGMWDWNIRTGEVRFDDHWVKSLGYRRDEVAPHVSFWEGILHPEDLQRVWSALQDHFEGRSPIYECHNRLRTRSGTFRQNLDRGKVVEWDADGRPLRMVGTDTDITERKRMEEQLRLTQFAIDHAADAIFIADTNKRFVYVNNEACRSLEYTRDELMDLTVFDIAPTHEPETFRKRFHILKETGVVAYETIHRTKSGSDIPIDLTINLFELNGTILMCAVARNITERKRAEAALEASKTRFRAIFDQTFQFIGLMKTDGTVIEANRSALQFAGIREEDVLGKLFWDTLWWTHSPELQNRLREAVRQAAGGTMVRFEATHPRPTGELAYVDFSLKPVCDEHGNVTLLIPEGRDITERKQAEEALRESEERYRTLMTHAPEAIVVLDVDRVGSCKSTRTRCGSLGFPGRPYCRQGQSN